MDAVSWPRGGHVFVVRNWPHELKVNINSNAVHLLVTNFRPRNCVHFWARFHRFFKFLVRVFFRFLKKIWPISGPEWWPISGQEKVAISWLGHSNAWADWGRRAEAARARLDAVRAIMEAQVRARAMAARALGLSQAAATSRLAWSSGCARPR